MPSTLKLIMLTAILAIITLSAVKAGQEILISEDPDIGKIYLLNIRAKDIDQECLKEKIKNIIYCIDNQQIDPYKVKIWASHTLVKDTLKARSVRIERSGSNSNILIPLQYKGKRLILYKGEAYGMYGVTSNKVEMNFDECAR